MVSRQDWGIRAAQLSSGVGILAITLSLASSPGTGDDEPQPAATQELQGVLPDRVPVGLGYEDFEVLGGKWKDWAGETAELVADFYESEDPDVAGRRETLNRMRVKLDTMAKALADSRYLPLHGPLTDLRSRLERRIDVAEAVLDGLEQDLEVMRQERLDAALPELASASSSLKNYLAGIPKGDLWVSYLRLDEVQSSAQAGDSGDDAKMLYFGVAEKLNNRTQLNEEQRTFLSRAPFLAFEERLQDVAQAAQSFDEDTYRTNLQRLSGELLTAIEKYEEEATDENAAAARATYDAIRRFAVDEGVGITKALRAHYLNYNLRFVAGEGLLKRLIQENRLERGIVNDRALGARLTGSQWTNSTVDIDLKPSGDGARFDIVLTGTICSNTRGDAGNAVVYSSGAHTFYGRKGVSFDGKDFVTFPSDVNVSANNQTTGVSTHVSWMPLIGGIADSIAYNEAQRRRGEANAYTRNKIYAEVHPRFDSEVDQRMQEAQLKMESDFYGPLREQGLFPDTFHYSSSDVDLTMRARIMESGELAGGTPPGSVKVPLNGALLEVHESLLNNAADRMELAGKSMSEEELRDHLRNRLEKLAGQPIEWPEPTQKSAEADEGPKVEAIVFHEMDPVRFEIDGGQLTIIIRAGMNLEDRDDIPTQIISVPLTLSLQNGRVIVERGTVGVRPLGPLAPGERAEQITRANIMRSKIQQTFDAQEFDGHIDLKIENKNIQLRLTELTARAGWLRISGS